MTGRKRRHERSKVVIIVQYVVEPSADTSFDGVVANVSESGFCLLTTHSLSKDDIIRVKKKIGKKSSAFSEKATVRWIDRSHKYYCRAGLEFV